MNGLVCSLVQVRDMEKGVEYTTSTQLHVVLLALQLPVLLYLLSGIGSDRVQELFYAVLASVVTAIA